MHVLGNEAYLACYMGDTQLEHMMLDLVELEPGELVLPSAAAQ